MVHKIVRENGTEIPNIKSCVYKRDINGETNLRVGCVSSANIEVTVYGKKKDAPDPGEKLQFYEMVSGGAWRLIGTFYAEPAITSISTYKFLAYDKVARLDVDFSARLWELQNAFPMSLYALVSYAATVAGVTLHSSVSSALSGITVKQFYADNITCRQIFSWAAELVGKYVIARTDNEQLTFIWYSEQANTRVYPTNTDLPIVIRNPIDVNAPAGTVYINVLASNVTEYQWQYLTSPNAAWRDASGGGYNTDRFTINLRSAIDGYQYRCKLTNTYGATYTDVITAHVDPDGTYVEPTDSPLHYDTEATVAYRQNGLQYENYTVAPVDCVAVFSVDDDNTSVIYPSSVSGDNIYSVYNNLLLTDATSTTLNTVAQNIYTALHSIAEYRPATMKLFPSENQISTGSIVAVTDAQGFSFATIVMSIVSDGAVDKLKSTGAETYEEADQVNQKSKIINMASSILRLKKLIVEEIEAVIARIETMFANEITVTGSLHSPDYQIVENSYSYNQPYAATGLGLEFGDGSINGQYFAVSRNGGVYSREAYFGDFHFADALRSSYTEMNIAPYQFLDSGGTASTNYEAITAAELTNNSYDAIKPKARSSISGYKANEKGKFVYHISTVSNGLNEIRYLNFNAIADSSIVDLLDKPVATVTYPASGQGTIVDQGSVTLEYGTYYPGTFNSLMNYKDALFYPVLPHPSATDLIVEIEVPAGAVIELDVVRGYYSAWYSHNNNHTYGGRGTYLGTDGISADKMQVNGNDVWNKGDFTFPLPIEQGGTGATEAIEALSNLHGIPVKGFTISSSSQAVLDFSGAVRFMLVMLGASTARHGVATVYSQGSSSTTYAVPVGTLGSAITLTPATGKLTVSATASLACYIVCFNSYTYDRITITNT